MCRCGTQGHGLVVDFALLRLMVGSVIIKAFSNLNNSMILSVLAMIRANSF